MMRIKSDKYDIFAKNNQQNTGTNKRLAYRSCYNLRTNAYQIFNTFNININITFNNKRNDKRQTIWMLQKHHPCDFLPTKYNLVKLFVIPFL